LTKGTFNKHPIKQTSKLTDNNPATHIYVYFTFPFVVNVARVAHLFRRMWEHFKIINTSLLCKQKLLRETLFSKVVEKIKNENKFQKKIS